MSKSNIKKLTFEQALSELEEIVRALESGAAELEAAISLYGRGVELKEHCESILAQAKLKVEEMVSQNGVAVSVAPSAQSD